MRFQNFFLWPRAMGILPALASGCSSLKTRSFISVAKP